LPSLMQTLSLPQNFRLTDLFFPMEQQPLLGQGLLIIEASRSRSDAPHSVGLLWTSDDPDAETLPGNTQQSQKTRHSCPRWDSNPQFQQANSRRSTP
jgi:hypothetical protein